MRGLLALLLSLGLFASARGQHHPAEDAELHHKFYSTWMMPSDRKQSCCNQRDCYPTKVKNVGGTWFARRREDGAWIPIPHNKLEQNQADPKESPDGRSHVCMPPPGTATVYCATLGVDF